MAQQADSEIPFGTVDSAEAKQMIDSGEYQVIDVRMPNQFAKAHIPDSVLAPLPELLQETVGIPRRRQDHFRLRSRPEQPGGLRDRRRHGLGRSLQPWAPASWAGSKTAMRSRKGCRRWAESNSQGCHIPFLSRRLLPAAAVYGERRSVPPA